LFLSNESLILFLSQLRYYLSDAQCVMMRNLITMILRCKMSGMIGQNGAVYETICRR